MLIKAHDWCVLMMSMCRTNLFLYVVHFFLNLRLWVVFDRFLQAVVHQIGQLDEKTRHNTFFTLDLRKKDGYKPPGLYSVKSHLASQDICGDGYSDFHDDDDGEQDDKLRRNDKSETGFISQ